MRVRKSWEVITTRGFEILEGVTNWGAGIMKIIYKQNAIFNVM